MVTDSTAGFIRLAGSELESHKSYAVVPSTPALLVIVICKYTVLLACKLLVAAKKCRLSLEINSLTCNVGSTTCTGVAVTFVLMPPLVNCAVLVSIKPAWLASTFNATALKVIATPAGKSLLFRLVTFPRLKVTEVPLVGITLFAGVVPSVIGCEQVTLLEVTAPVTLTKAMPAGSVSTMVTLVVTPCGTSSVRV